MGSTACMQAHSSRLVTVICQGTLPPAPGSKGLIRPACTRSLRIWAKNALEHPFSCCSGTGTGGVQCRDRMSLQPPAPAAHAVRTGHAGMSELECCRHGPLQLLLIPLPAGSRGQRATTWLLKRAHNPSLPPCPSAHAEAPCLCAAVCGRVPALSLALPVSGTRASVWAAPKAP